MAQIALREVDRQNWRDVLRLSVSAHQQRFIADYAPIALVVLAKAYVRPGGMVWVPYAIYADADVIGMAELAYTPGSHDQYWIYHLADSR